MCLFESGHGHCQRRHERNLSHSVCLSHTLCAYRRSFFAEHILRGGFTAWAGLWRLCRRPAQRDAGLQRRRTVGTAAGRLPPGSEGLMLVPYWNNVMSPIGTYCLPALRSGWTATHGREHFYRGYFRGHRLRAAAGRRCHDGSVRPALDPEYVTMGGGSRSKLWCQIMADVTGVPVLRSTTAEATCLGAGILAAAAVSWRRDVKAAADAMTTW